MDQEVNYGESREEATTFNTIPQTWKLDHRQTGYRAMRPG